MIFNSNKKKAFTLAEVLIVLGVVGVVAALTLPTLISNVTTKIKANRIKNINAKLAQGTDKLMVLGQINGYETTEDFVKALSEHFKISSWCKGDKIAECFPYDKIKVDTDNGEDFVEVKDLTVPESFGLNSETWGEPVSFVSADGVPYIIMYNKKCNIDDGDGRSNSKACIAGIYDYNGSREPNKFVTDKDSETNMTSVDIQFMGNVTKIGKCIAYQKDGDLKPAIGPYKAFKVLDGFASSWNATVNDCKDMGMELPDSDTLVQIMCQAKGLVGKNTIGYYTDHFSNIEITCQNTETNDILANKYSYSVEYWSSTRFSTDSAFLISAMDMVLGATPIDDVTYNDGAICVGK